MFWLRPNIVIQNISFKTVSKIGLRLGVFKKKVFQRQAGFEELLMKIKGIDYRKCSHCDNGKLITIKEIEKKDMGLH